MVELRARTACEGLLPLEIGELSLTEVAPTPLTTLAPYKGQVAALDKALLAAHGMAFPAANNSSQAADLRAIWFGRDQALLIGTKPDAALARHAALTDQSQGWAVVELSGEGVEDVLARLCPVDLRLQQFAVGASLRTEVRHMMASVTRTGEKAFMIMVFRSMARTLVHDLKTAMEAWAARG